MRLLIGDGSATPPIEVEARPEATTTLHDLVLAALGRRATPTHVLVDGRPVEPDRLASAAALTRGTCLQLPADEADPRGARARPGGRRLVVIGGLDAGRDFPLAPGDHTIGREPGQRIVLDAASVSRRHARLTVAPTGQLSIVDLASTNGTRVDQRPVTRRTDLDVGQSLQVGAVVATVRVDEPAASDPAPVPARPPAPDGTHTVNRPPRLAAAAALPPLAVPAEPRTVVARLPFSWAMFLAPLVLGLVMARVAGPVYAVFALLSPVLLVASWFEQRRRARRAGRRDGRARRRHLEAFAHAVEARVAAEAARRHQARPDPARVLAVARTGGPRLWERRRGDADFGRLRVGTADLPWHPELQPSSPPSAAVQAVLDEHGRLRGTPVELSIADRQVIGLAGPAEVVRAVARALVVQAAVAHGPADLRVTVRGLEPARQEWSFVSWLPHTLPGPDGPTFGLDALQEAAAAQGAAASDRSGPERLVVLDLHPRRPDDGADADAPAVVRGDPDQHAATEAGLRLASRLVGRHPLIVVAPTARDLPSACSAVVVAHGPDGAGRVVRPEQGTTVERVLLDGLAPAIARRAAHHLARWRDPELVDDQLGIPARSDLLELLDLVDLRGGPTTRGIDDEAVARRWDAHPGDDGLTAVLGVGTGGPALVDLVADGPHALVGGTTGSGKSELLRTLVLSLAATYPPTTVTFVLVDYKGGSTFDPIAGLPHVVGLVTDLDRDLADRALRSLDAELRRREQLLRNAGVDDLAAYGRRPVDGSPRPPLPRLVVVIDEFATLAQDAPGFLDALVGVAQRGRSLGIHLVLATQRPHGSVNDNIRTNTNLRIALRVLERADSVDLIDRPDAAALDRRRPGRGLVRIGGDEPVTVQVARVAGRPAPTPRPTWPDADPPCPLVVRLDEWGLPRPTRATAGPTAGDTATEATEPGATVAALVRAVRAAHDRRGDEAPRRPWLPPLPPDLTAADLDDALRREPDRPRRGGAARPGTVPDVPLGLVDDPDRQRTDVWAWSPTTGPLVLHGRADHGVTAALAHVAHTLATTTDPDDCHLYLIDAGGLPGSTWASVAHVGAVVGVDDRARLERLVTFLDRTWRRRRLEGSAGEGPALVVVVEQFAALRSGLDDLDGARSVERLCRIAADGAAHGIHVALGGDRPQAVPSAVVAATTARLVLHHTDPYDHTLLGVRRPPPAEPPGRAVTLDGLAVQLARPLTPTPPATPGPAGPRRCLPTPIGVLPDQVHLDELDDLDDLLGSSGAPGDPHDPDDSVAAASPVVRGRPGPDARLALVVGLGDRDLRPRRLDLEPGDHLLVAGPPRSGRTTALRLLATQAARQAPGRTVLVTARPDPAPHPDGVRVLRAIDDLWTLLDAWVAAPGPTGPTTGPTPVVLIDDADSVHHDRLDELVRSADRGRVTLVAAARVDRLRRPAPHWTRAVRDSRVGLALGAPGDTDLWGVRRPARVTDRWPAGRGVLVADGTTEVVQVARP